MRPSLGSIKDRITSSLQVFVYIEECSNLIGYRIKRMKTEYAGGRTQPLFYCSAVLGKICTAKAGETGSLRLEWAPHQQWWCHLTKLWGDDSSGGGSYVIKNFSTQNWTGNLLSLHVEIGGGGSWQKFQICFKFSVWTQFFMLNPNLALVSLADASLLANFAESSLFDFKPAPLYSARHARSNAYQEA